jgi:hypothetical protein
MSRHFILPTLTLPAVLILACQDQPTEPKTDERGPADPAAVLTSSIAIDKVGDVGAHTSLEIGPDKRMHVTYANRDGGFKYATCGGSCGSASSWVRGVIQASGEITGSSLKLSAAGRLHVSYSDETGNLKVAACGPDAACTDPAKWTKTLIESVGPFGGSSSLALGPDGSKALSYVRRKTGSDGFLELKYAVCLSFCGQAANWSMILVDRITTPASFPREVTSLAIGPDGRRHISYYDPALRRLKYATCLSGCDRSAGWKKATIDAAYGAGWYNSIAVGQDGVIHVSYYDSWNGDLKYARCGFDCTTAARWKTVPVLASIDAGEYTALYLEAGGRVHVSYFDVTNTALGYATCGVNCTAPGSWTTGVQDQGLSSTGKYSSIEVRGAVVHITYYDVANGDLRYLVRRPLAIP